MDLAIEFALESLRGQSARRLDCALPSGLRERNIVVIRRETLASDGGPLWLLIAQTEHARLAGELAARWRWPALSPPAPLLGSPLGGSEFLEAVFRHDDGWQAWDTRPSVDPRRGCPLAFTEMPMDVSTALWTGSIEVAQRIGPLATLMVAGHFLALAEHHDHWRRGNAAARAAGESFIGEARSRIGVAQLAWLAERETAIGSTAAPQIAAREADAALAWLQFFDALSLWLCCRAPASPESFALPSSGATHAAASVCFRPRASEAIEVGPWPFATPAFSLRAMAKSVPARPVALAELDLEGYPGEELTWRFEPSDE